MIIGSVDKTAETQGNKILFFEKNLLLCIKKFRGNGFGYESEYKRY